jgi:TonB family protein
LTWLTGLFVGLSIAYCALRGSIIIDYSKEKRLSDLMQKQAAGHLYSFQQEGRKARLYGGRLLRFMGGLVDKCILLALTAISFIPLVLSPGTVFNRAEAPNDSVVEPSSKPEASPNRGDGGSIEGKGAPDPNAVDGGTDDVSIQDAQAHGEPEANGNDQGDVSEGNSAGPAGGALSAGNSSLPGNSLTGALGASEGNGVGPFRIGGGVSAPEPIYKVEPDYSEEAREAKFQGKVILEIVVDETGKVTNVRVIRPPGMGLDEKAVEAVAKWRFRPGHKDGKPVPVMANVEVNFRLL